MTSLSELERQKVRLTLELQQVESKIKLVRDNPNTHDAIRRINSFMYMGERHAHATFIEGTGGIAVSPVGTFRFLTENIFAIARERGLTARYAEGDNLQVNFEPKEGSA